MSFISACNNSASLQKSDSPQIFNLDTLQLTKDRVGLELIIDSLYHNRNLLTLIQAEADKRKVCYQEMVWLYGENILDGREILTKKANFIRGIKDKINKSNKWLEDVKRKSLEHDVTLDQMIQIDAEYLYNSMYKDSFSYEPMALGLANYLFLGHSYQHGVYDEVDQRIPEINLDYYDMILLGGDITVATTKDEHTLEYLDSLYNLKNKNTLWALGNHDVRDRNINRITQVTQRPLHYAYASNELTFMVLNTNYNNPQSYTKENECAQIEDQFNMIKAISDTIVNSSHLIVMHHHMIWSDSLIEKQRLDPNLKIPNQLFSCKDSLNFTDGVYPLLKKVQKRGVQVICLCGDFGMFSKGFDYTNKDGITFLGSGINNSATKKYGKKFGFTYKPDMLLVFQHDTTTSELKWEFKEVNSLIESP